jgi:transposase-like protein
MSNNNGKQAQIPDPQVEPRAERRHYTQAYKERILAEIDAAQEPGEIGALLRREGLYSQIISKWRQQQQQGTLAGTTSAPRGPKVDPASAEMTRLQRENEQLRARLERAEQIIEIQKKVSQLLETGENYQWGTK